MRAGWIENIMSNENWKLKANKNRVARKSVKVPSPRIESQTQRVYPQEMRSIPRNYELPDAEKKKKILSKSMGKFMLAGFLIASEILFLILAGCLSNYDSAALPKSPDPDDPDTPTQSGKQMQSALSPKDSAAGGTFLFSTFPPQQSNNNDPRLSDQRPLSVPLNNTGLRSRTEFVTLEKIGPRNFTLTKVPSSYIPILEPRDSPPRADAQVAPMQEGNSAIGVLKDVGETKEGKEEEPNELQHYYAMFQDVHVMIFIGFGFLMTFLKKYGYSSVSINFLLAAYAIQWHTLLLGLFKIRGAKFTIGIEQLILSEFCAGAVLISMGAVLGKVTAFQYLIMTFIEVIFFTINEYLVFDVFVVTDVGGSMNLHAFGAYFGLVAAWIMHKPKAYENPNQSPVYHSDLFSMIGTIFLWVFWPSFNAAVSVPADGRHRAVINTYFSLAASTITAFACSALFDKKGKFEMEHVQNATLAGGVAIGSAASCLISPFGSMLVGSIAGIVSTVGFRFISAILEKFRLHDTCGVHNLHGMPGIIGGVVSIIMAGTASHDQYHDSLYEIFPARDPTNDDVMVSPNRTGGIQAGFQFLALVISIVLGAIGGGISALLMKLACCDQVNESEEFFNDRVNFHVADDFDDSHPITVQLHEDGDDIRSHHSEDRSSRRGSHHAGINIYEERTI